MSSFLSRVVTLLQKNFMRSATAFHNYVKGIEILAPINLEVASSWVWSIKDLGGESSEDKLPEGVQLLWTSCRATNCRGANLQSGFKMLILYL